MLEHLNAVLAILLAVTILIGWQWFVVPRFAPKPATVPILKAANPKAPAPFAELSSDVRLPIHSSSLHGSVPLTSERLDDITLIKYRQTIDPASAEISVLSRAQGPKPYFAEFGWVAEDPATKVPDATTVWQANTASSALGDSTPLVLTWTNEKGLRFTKIMRVDQGYMFTIDQTVENTGDQAVTLQPYASLSRTDTPDTKGTPLLEHEGPLGVLGRSLKDVSYSRLKKERHIETQTIGGWIGFTDRYWLTAVAFDQSLPADASFDWAESGNRDRYQTNLRTGSITLQPGTSYTVRGFLFAGPKEVGLLDGYAQNPGIARLDAALDNGWLSFLIKPFLYALVWLKGILGNFGLAILAFTTVVRLLLFPWVRKQFAALNKARQMQPKLKRLQQKYANDRVKLSQETMELHEREGTNPLAGCLPSLIQAPIFIALYTVLTITIEMRHAPFYGWIHDLSAADPTNIFTLFGLLHIGLPAFLHVGALPIIYGTAMWLGQLIGPPVADPAQAKVMTYLPVIVTFIWASIPAGVVIYLTWNSLLSSTQQYLMRRHSPTP